MKTRDIRVVVARPGEAPVIKMVPNTLESLQAEVGGQLEMIGLYRGDVHLHAYVDEDGMYKNLPVNRVLNGMMIRGPIVVSRMGRSGNETGLTEKNAEIAIAALGGTK